VSIKGLGLLCSLVGFAVGLLVGWVPRTYFEEHFLYVSDHNIDWPRVSSGQLAGLHEVVQRAVASKGDRFRCAIVPSEGGTQAHIHVWSVSAGGRVPPDVVATVLAASRNATNLLPTLDHGYGVAPAGNARPQK